MSVGRPTDYKDEYCEEIIKFFNVPPYIDSPIVITNKDGSTAEKTERLPNQLPTLAGFARSIGVNRDTIQEWTKKHKEFSVALKFAKDCQEDILIQNGLIGLYQGSFAIMATKNLIAWRDKQEVEHSGNVTIAATKLDEEL